ncbi:hypothetical protein DDZ18_11810 [Marinicauda salina]|uniref:Uncharacterized protein n=1 Tax=Marinicauda salina TaxID=2135793 RepID=A0A2U2BS97_9PROT|nr:hypothetical protein [Marinicauda salina]PWE16866.1 hypothetical protein DDZ18_11810 [Marinicauda salina]
MPGLHHVISGLFFFGIGYPVTMLVLLETSDLNATGLTAFSMMGVAVVIGSFDKAKPWGVFMPGSWDRWKVIARWLGAIMAIAGLAGGALLLSS